MTFRAHHPCFSGIASLVFRLILIRHVPAIALVMHVCDLVNLLQGRRFAVRADGQRVIREVLEVLEMPQALVAMVDVDRHKSDLPVSTSRMIIRHLDHARLQQAGCLFRFERAHCL